jgi:protein SCO1/2
MLLVCTLARGQALQLPPPPVAGFAPVVGAALPLGSALVDASGAPVRLSSLFGRRPVVLVPGYYTCPNLCSTTFEGVLQGLGLSGLKEDEYEVVGVSIDPLETTATAAAKQRAYLTMLPGSGANLHLLTGAAPAIGAITRASGYRFSRADDGQFAHAAGFVVATPDGRVAAGFPGVRFDAAALRRAVRAAARGVIPQRVAPDRVAPDRVTPDRVAPDRVARAGGTGDADGAGGGIASGLLLLCAHYDPASGRYSFAAMSAVRALALLVLALLGGFMWLRRRKP